MVKNPGYSAWILFFRYITGKISYLHKKKMLRIFQSLVLIFCFFQIHAQDKPLTYYLPDIEYDEDIPTPKEYLGWQIGDWHISHDLLQGYLRLLASSSDRVYIEEYARSHEDRPLMGLIFTSLKNQRNINKIKAERSDIMLGKGGSERPVVIYQGYSIHGNESSGANAAVLIAYYLAAGQSQEIEDMLKEAIIIVDPCLNPDGLNRFASWANTHKSKILNPDTNGREFKEAWPRGRTNHYWFDLNRDWLPLVHPESQGRIKMFHQWKPNILTDHHEMGSDNTFFFQPGIPTRTNPITPQKNQDLTSEIAKFHAAELDKIGSLYYSKESFDDFYYGKGSTYPDVNGCIGILFEQASSRGHLRKTKNGLLSFPFTIRNQIATSISTQKAGYALRKELKSFQDDFYKTKAPSSEAYLIQENRDHSRLEKFIHLLSQHQIKVYKKKKGEYLVPIDQPQHRLIGTIFETNTTFRDSLFYDVSTWTMPLAYNLNVSKKSGLSWKDSELITNHPVSRGSILGKSNYGYVFRWDDFYSPKLLYALQKKGLRTKVASKSFAMNHNNTEESFTYGTIIIPIQNQILDAEEIYILLTENLENNNINIYPISSGLSSNGIDLGSPSIQALDMPKIMLVIEGSVSSYDAGHLWHLFDQVYNIPITLVETSNVNSNTLSNYNTVVLVQGANPNAKALKTWVEKGGVLITCKSATQNAINNNLAHVKFKPKDQNKSKKADSYINASNKTGAQIIGGAIFETNLDLGHPLTYGYHQDKLAIFKRGTLTLGAPTNQYAAPLSYTANPLLSGYISKSNLKHMANSSSVVVSGSGKGKVISFVDNPNFRGFWLGTNKLLANAVFFGSTINRNAIATSK